jgi:hypothetical protein
MPSPCCLGLCNLHINFLMPKPVSMKIDMYIMTPEPNLKVCFINFSHQSMCLYVYAPSVAKQLLDKNFKAAKNIHATMEELLDEPFSMLSFSCQRN